MKEKSAKKELSEFTSDQENFIKDLSDCTRIAQTAFGVDKIDPQVAFALFDAFGPPEDHAPSEREQFGEDLRKAVVLAKETFRNATSETFLKVFYIFTQEIEDAEGPEEAFQLSVKMAKKLFGDNFTPEAVLEIFERFFVVEEDEDEEEDPDDDA